MTDAVFSELQDQFQSGGATAVFDRLIATLRERKEYHRLFDALCLKKKLELGAPLIKPTSFEDIPTEKHDEFEATYVAAARDVGKLLLADKKLSQAFVYFHAIREVQPLRDAIDAAPVPMSSNESSEELIDLGLYKMVHPAKAVQVLLKTHGTCSTITSLDQSFINLTPEQRSDCAALLVKNVHADLLQSVERDVKQRIPFAEPAKTLREWIAGRDWLFDENNYHIDVSHLHSTVRFARSLAAGLPEIALARDLAEYGSHLAPQFQYPAEPPFVDFYPAHIQYFKFLLDDQRDEAFAYFQKQLDNEPDASDKALITYVMVDLLTRVDRLSAALPLAEQYLLNTDQDFAAAFAELCQKANRFDILQQSAQNRGDLVTYAAALVRNS